MPRILPGLLVVILCPLAARGDVRLAPIFNNRMVLQRGMPVPVWGTATPGEEVTVAFLSQKKTTTAGRDGTWQIKLDTLEAGGPHRLSVRGKNTIELSDVLVGEVWVCSGQSNMVWRLKQSDNAIEESKTANHPRIRFHAAGGNWQPCTPDSALAFSACAYYFGRDLHRALGVPIGLINRSVGGTSARLWTPRETVEKDVSLASFRKAILSGQPTREKKERPAGFLYAQHIQPIVPFAMRGVIWYQGESDAARPEEYAVLFPALIRSWRRAWGQGDFPFLYAQLAPIDEKRPVKWVALREVQFQTLALPRTGMAVIIDSDVDIHPRKKQLVGTRLALAARAIAYGEKIVYSGPIYDTMTVEGNKVVLRFRHVGGGLRAQGSATLTGFEVVKEDGTAVPAEARIDGERVVVWSKDVARPIGVRYAWTNAPRCNLTNKEGLPATPFRTDKPGEPRTK